MLSNEFCGLWVIDFFRWFVWFWYGGGVFMWGFCWVCFGVRVYGSVRREVIGVFVLLLGFFWVNVCCGVDCYVMNGGCGKMVDGGEGVLFEIREGLI